jgi:Cof subfamily protein (haloacid dehalogenase superfamily)
MPSSRPIRLIVTDLDGTLLDSHHRVTPFTERVLREAIAHRVLFTAATGKTFLATTGLIEQFGIQIPMICNNGTSIHGPDGTVLHEDPLPSEYAAESIQMARAAGLTPIVYSGTKLLAPVWNENVALLVEFGEPTPHVIPNLAAALGSDYLPHKLIFMKESDVEAIAQFQARLTRVFKDRATVLCSTAFAVELLPLGVTKGTAVAFLQDYLSIPAQQTFCIGDNCNDLDMIRQAGIGVAMGHAPEAVRKGADYVTGTNDEDGVGHAIDKLVLARSRAAA